MTRIEKEVRKRERDAINAVNKSAEDLKDIYNDALTVLWDVVLVLVGIVLGMYLSAMRTQAAETVSIPPRAVYVGPITEAAPEALPEVINEVPVATMPDAVMVEPVGTRWEYLGRWKTTGYCPCRRCNGRNAGRTASGAPMIPGRTVAVGWLPFGTVLKIGDKEYVVEDRGVHGNHADVLYPNHQTASNHGVQYMAVWIKR